MMMNQWVKLPTKWIVERRLKRLKWSSRGEGSNSIAALMVLFVLAHNADQNSGSAHLTYDQLCEATGISRAKVAGGLAVLREQEIISDAREPRSSYRIQDFDPNGGWAKLPARRWYSGSSIEAFQEFQLRKQVELNALKLLLLFAAMRNRNTNFARIGYDKITEYTGVDRPHIKQATSVLAALDLVRTETLSSEISEYGVSNAYRLVGIDPYIHMGTRGRSLQLGESDG